MSITIDNEDGVSVPSKIADHGVDALCAIGIVASVALGEPNTSVIGGLVSIALGKRVLKK